MTDRKDPAFEAWHADEIERSQQQRRRHASHRQALHQLLDRYCIMRPDREQLIEDILKIGVRFLSNQDEGR